MTETSLEASQTAASVADQVNGWVDSIFERREELAQGRS